MTWRWHEMIDMSFFVVYPIEKMQKIFGSHHESWICCLRVFDFVMLSVCNFTNSSFWGSRKCLRDDHACGIMRNDELHRTQVCRMYRMYSDIVLWLWLQQKLCINRVRRFDQSFPLIQLIERLQSWATPFTSYLYWKARQRAAYIESTINIPRCLMWQYLLQRHGFF